MKWMKRGIYIVKINNLLVQRLKMNEIAMDIGYENFVEAIKTADDTKVYIALSEVLGWIKTPMNGNLK